MFLEERQKAILEILAERGNISTAYIQRHFQVGYDTAKRDLFALEAQGLLKRTHGGAIPLQQVAAGKPAGVTCKDITEIKENYLAIAKKALTLLHNNDVIFITAATVGYFMAQHLPEPLHLRVVTNSIIMAEELRHHPNVTVLLLGGEMDSKGNCYDAFAVNMIRQMRFDTCFLTSAAISPDFGLSIQKSGAIPFWNAVIDASHRAVGLYPTEKIGQDSIIRICPSERLDTIIADWNITADDKSAFEEHGIEVQCAENPVPEERAACVVPTNSTVESLKHDETTQQPSLLPEQPH